MKSLPKFEYVCASLLNRGPIPTLEIYFGELSCEEQRINTHYIMEEAHVASNIVSVSYVAHRFNKAYHAVVTFSALQYAIFTVTMTTFAINLQPTIAPLTLESM